MPKKKASNRLKNVFDGLTPEESLASPKQGAKKTRPSLEQTPSPTKPDGKTGKLNAEGVVKDPPKTKPLKPIEIQSATSTAKTAPLVEANKIVEVESPKPPAGPSELKKINPILVPKMTGRLPALSTETMTESTQDGGSVLSFAFQAKEDDWAVLRIISDPNRHWTDDEQLLVKQVTDQLSLALENAYLFQDSQRRANEMTALAQIGREISSTLNTESVLQRIAEHALELLRGASAAIYIPNHDFTILDPIATSGEDAAAIKDGKLEIGTGIIGRIAIARTGEIVNNVNLDPRSLTIDGTEDTPNEHLMVVPILTQDTLRGILSIWRIGPGQEFIKTEFDFLTSLAQQAAVTIENARLFEEEQRRASELQAVSEISSALSTILNEQRLLEEFAYLTRKRFNLYHAHIFMLEENKHTLTIKACGWVEEEKKGSLDAHTIDINQPISLVAKAARTHQTVIQNDVSEDPTWLPNPLLPNVKSEMAVPVFSQEKLLGILNIHSDRTQAFTDSDAAIMTTLATQIGAVIQNTRLFQQIRASQTQLSEALRIARLGYSESDPVNDTITMTDELYALLETNAEKEGGYSHPLNHMLKEYIVAEDESIAINAVHQALMVQNNDTSEISAELRFKTRSNKIIWVRTIYKTERDLAGNAIKIISSAQDITESKIAEEAIQRRNQYLATSAEISRIVTSTLDLDTIFARTVSLVAERFSLYHAAIFTTDETKFNATFREGTGAAGESMKKARHSVPVNDKNIIGSVIWTGEALVLGDTSTDLRYKPDPLLPETRSEAGIPLRIGNRTIGVLDIQSTQMNAFSDNDLAVLQTLADQVAIAIDNARSYEISQQAVLEMRETDRVKSQFLANMSHELRTPLNSIIGFSRVILKGIDGPVTELQQQDLTAIYNSGQHLLALINDILDLSKIEAGKMELAFDDVNMIDLINSVLSTITGLIKDKPITLKKIIPGDLPLVRADAIRMRQVMLNLLSNAAKFTDEGEIKVQAEVKNGPADKPELVVSVTDSGPGISSEDQKKLFQAFSQVDDSPTRKTGGTGLGLSISDRLVQMHGGRIGVISNVGQGSTFYFALPVPQESEQASADPDTKIILAIDDDEKVISLYERYLEPQGYKVVSVTDPAKAREKIAQIKPFAITLDIMMPNIDGWQILSEIKANPETRDIPVVICSIIDDHEKGFSLGASDYLTKPILEEDLLDALDRLNADGSIKDVLVIDDDPNDLRLIGKMLADQGRYKPVLAEGGPRGWQIIQEAVPQAMIIDLFMPEMDGFSIVEKMRSDPKLMDVPVIMVTGGDLTQEQQEKLNNMGQLLLNKGTFNADELFITIERALQRIQTKKKK